MVLNLTAGMGGDLGLGPGETPMAFNQELTDLVGPMERIIHIDALRPEICTLDCGSMNFGEDFVVINTDMLGPRQPSSKSSASNRSSRCSIPAISGSCARWSTRG